MRLPVLLLVAAAACGSWSKKDTALELGFVTATAVDWYQSRAIVHDCAENNPLLGRCGERIDVNLYMPTSMLLHAAVAAALPPKWRTVWQSVGIGAEVSVIWNNSLDGVK